MPPRNPGRGYRLMSSRGLAALIACASVMIRTPAGAEVRVGEAFPPFERAGLLGARIPATSGKVVLVDFWASWCAPCKASFPAYERLNSEFSSKGLVIVAVSVDRDATAYTAFVKRFTPSFLVVLDRDQKLVREAQVPTMPTSYIIDRQGRVRYAHPGFHGYETEKALRTEIAMLLSE